MKKIFRSYLFVFIGVLGFLASCSKSEISTLMPKDATMVAAIDMDTLCTNFGGDELVPTFMKVLDVQSDKSEKTKEESAFVKKCLESPQKTGLNFHKPFYAFHSPSLKHDVIVVGEVLDDDALATFFEEVTKTEKEDWKFGEYEGLSYSLYKNVLFAYNSKWFFALQNKKKWGTLEQNLDEIVGLLEMDEKESIQLDKDFKQMTKTNGIAQMIVRGAFVEEMCDRFMVPVDSLQKYLPKNTSFSDFSCLLNYDFKAKNIKYSLKVIGLNAKAEDALDHLPIGEISGDFNQYVSNEAIMTFATSMKGGVIFDRILMKIPEFKAWVLTYSQEVNLFRQWLMSINGDIIFSLGNAQNVEPEASVLLQMHNTSWVENPLLESLPGVKKTGDATFEFPTSEGCWSIGCATLGKNDIMYALMGNGQKELAPVAKPIDLGMHVNFYAKYNFDAFSKSKWIDILLKNNSLDPMQKMVLMEMFDYMDVTVTNKREITMNIVSKVDIKDVIVNALKAKMAE